MSKDSLIIALGLVLLCLRPFFSAISIGTNDIITWYGFARHILDSGLLSLYPADPLFNHPPLAGLFSAAMLSLADESTACFPYIFRAPGIIADGVAALLVYKIHKAHESSRASLAFLAVSASLINILICSYHGNTDPLYATLTVAAFLVAVSGSHALASGLLLGAAFNVKIIPILFLPALLASFSNNKERLKCLLGFCLLLLPFIVVGVQVGKDFWTNIFFYSGFSGYWGVLLFLKLSVGNFPDQASLIYSFIGIYGTVSKIIIFAAICCCSLKAMTRKSFSAIRLAALSGSIFAVLAPGFAGQYFVVITLLILAHSLKDGLWLSLWSGLLILSSYYQFLERSYPLFSNHTATGGKLTLFLGFLTWLCLVLYTGKELKTLFIGQDILE